jgi:DNA-binding IclR family transcriptional regulator
MWEADQRAVNDTPINRAIRTLELLSVQDGKACTPEYLATATGTTVPIIRRLLRTLVEQGLIIEGADEASYIFGPRALRLSNLIQSNLPLERIARPVMQALVAEFDETVTINAYLRSEGMSICVAVEECEKPMQYMLEPGELKQLHSGASGKTILAFLPDDTVERIIQHRGLNAVTTKTITSRATLARDLKRVRLDGVAVSHGERINGAVGIGAPVFGGSGQVLASLTMTIPEMRCSQVLIAAARRAVRRQAETLSSILGEGSGSKAATPSRPAVRQRRKS